jgi:PAS domain S-box-containing protein
MPSILHKPISNTVSQSNGITFFSVDKQYCYTSFSPIHKQVMNKIWGKEISLGMNMLDILEGHDREKAKKNFDKAFAGEGFTKIEDYGDSHLTRSFWEDHYDPIIDESGNVTGVMVFVLDISHRKDFIETLRDSNERLGLAMKAASVGIWEWDLITNDVFWSDEILSIYDLDPTFRNLSFEKYISFVHLEDRQQLQKDIAKSLENLQPYFTQHRVIPPDGRLRHIEGMGKVLLQNDKPVKMIGTVVDITERKKLESEKKDWETRYELVTRASGQIVYDYYLPSGKIIWSENILKEIGYTQEEIGNVDTWGDRIHPDDREEAFALLEKAQENFQEYDVTYRFLSKTNGYLHMWDRGFFMPNNHGKAYRMLGVMQNITKEKISENELRESESRYRTLQEASFGGIALHKTGKIMDANLGLASMTGFSITELIGMNGLNLVAPEFHDIVLENIKKGYDRPYDAIGVRKDGSRYSIEVHGKNVPYRGETLRVTEFRDISERKKSEEKIIEQNKSLTLIAEDLKKKNEQLEEFTQIVSHNLRSPVSNILGLLDLYEKSTDQEERAYLFKMLRESGSKILGNLHELNEVLKIRQNRDIEKQVLSFQDTLQGIKNQLSAKIAETKAKITSDFKNAPEVVYPNIYLESILMNLISNALKYQHPERVPQIHVYTQNSDGGIVMKVRDNGLGLDLKKYGNHIFKLRKTFHRHPESRGIGLFMIKNQIEAMGGEITIESELNIGTTFTVLLNK